jgi:hypothetical protein
MRENDGAIGAGHHGDVKQVSPRYNKSSTIYRHTGASQTCQLRTEPFRKLGAFGPNGRPLCDENQNHHHSFCEIAVRSYSFGILSRPSSPTSATAKHPPQAMSPKMSEPCRAWTLGLLKLENSDINPNSKTNALAIRLRLSI